jgi:hypothetical protein
MEVVEAGEEGKAEVGEEEAVLVVEEVAAAAEVMVEEEVEGEGEDKSSKGKHHVF